MRTASGYGMLLLLWTSTAVAQPTVDPQLDAELLRGIDAALHEDYARAESLCAAVTRRFPLTAAGPVLQAGILQQEMDDLGLPLDRGRYDSLLTLGELRSAGAEGRDKGWELVFVATSRGMTAVEAADRGNWMTAFRAAVASASAGEEALAEDSLLVDAGLPLGSYYYWKSRKTQVLNWLPFIDDRRSEGLGLLRRCASSGRYHRHGAMNALVWILIDAGSLDEAASWARKGLEDYPANRTFRRGLAAVFERQGHFLDAASAWAEIAESLDRTGARAIAAEFIARVNRARCLVKAEAGAETRAELDRAQALVPRVENLRTDPRITAKLAELSSLNVQPSASGAR